MSKKEEKEKTEFVLKTLKDFFDSWGNDTHTNILLEVLFEGLMNDENLFIFGEQKQKRN